MKPYGVEEKYHIRWYRYLPWNVRGDRKDRRRIAKDLRERARAQTRALLHRCRRDPDSI